MTSSHAINSKASAIILEVTILFLVLFQDKENYAGIGKKRIMSFCVDGAIQKSALVCSLFLKLNNPLDFKHVTC